MSSLKELQDLIHEKYGIEASALDPHASMRDKGFDSLALVEFLFAIEDHFAHLACPTTTPNIDTLAATGGRGRQGQGGAGQREREVAVTGLGVVGAARRRRPARCSRR